MALHVVRRRREILELRLQGYSGKRPTGCIERGSLDIHTNQDAVYAPYHVARIRIVVGRAEGGEAQRVTSARSKHLSFPYHIIPWLGQVPSESRWFPLLLLTL